MAAPGAVLLSVNEARRASATMAQGPAPVMTRRHAVPSGREGGPTRGNPHGGQAEPRRDGTSVRWCGTGPPPHERSSPRDGVLFRRSVRRGSPAGRWPEHVGHRQVLAPAALPAGARDRNAARVPGHRPTTAGAPMVRATLRRRARTARRSPIARTACRRVIGTSLRARTRHRSGARGSPWFGPVTAAGSTTRPAGAHRLRLGRRVSRGPRRAS